MNLKNGKVFTSKFVGAGPSSYKKRIYRAAVSQRLRNTAVGNTVMNNFWVTGFVVTSSFFANVRNMFILLW